MLEDFGAWTRLGRLSVSGQGRTEDSADCIKISKFSAAYDVEDTQMRRVVLGQNCRWDDR